VTVPERPALEGLESTWDAVWQRDGIYRFDGSAGRDRVYAIDTPPPTVSGQLHIGTVFGYVQVDAIARFQRMRGREVFYPIGWDDNGLPTERRVQNLYGVQCDPAAAYEPDAVYEQGSGRRPISRRNFLELCQRQTAVDERAFESVFRGVGLSVDWSLVYTTIDERSRRTAQRGFLRNLERGEAYAAEAPTLWDVDFRTAIAQAELEDRPVTGTAVRLAFSAPDGGVVEVETTRPELLPGCVALVVPPGDERFAELIGASVRTPLFEVAVPVLEHPLADPAKGTGIAMVCTFGDTTDVVWWRELRLPLRVILGRDGRFRSDRPEWLVEQRAWEALAGRSATQARRAVIEELAAAGALLGEPRQIAHDVKFYEKGDRPLEIVTSRQWYISNGSRDAERRDALLRAGRELGWTPDFMRVRYEHWVQGLNTDWLVSRQRYFGVPFPVWYPVDASGQTRWEETIVADEGVLPVDPQSEVPPGYQAAQRGQPGGFVGDPDIMDTWATSSLTPQIVTGWEDDPELFARTFPMDLRPQGPEIIRTWLFSTLLRSQLEHGVLPWAQAEFNGWILDPDRKKMSKSKGNLVTPAGLIQAHGADAVRYWSCKAAPGVDTAVDEAQMKIGRRLAVKLLNASKFVLGLGSGGAGASGRPVGAGGVADTIDVTQPLDLAMLAQLAAVIDEATRAFEAYQYQQALERIEAFFWQFCDDYVELVKSRAYGDGWPETSARSARAALSVALSTVQRLLAPFLPFAAEEVWSWWQPGSVHRSAWPVAAEFDGPGGAPSEVFGAAAAVLREIRKAKTMARKGMRSEVRRLEIDGNAEHLAAVRAAAADLRAAGSVQEMVLTESGDDRVLVELA